MTLFDELLREAKAGNTQAQMEVAEAYFKGIYVIKNYNEALYWLEKASDNNKYAPMQMTNMYRNGIGVKKDLKKAFDIALEYANKGNEILMFELAGDYLNGVGCDPNLDLALEWYQKSFEAGYGDSAYYLGYLYQTNNAIKDNEKVIEWYTKAAELNNGRACYNLGYIYHDGTIVKKDNQKALEYLNKAVNLGVNEAKALIDEVNADNGYFGYSIYI
jgi:TPR repeat protein